MRLSSVYGLHGDDAKQEVLSGCGAGGLYICGVVRVFISAVINITVLGTQAVYICFYI
jgi:hypothetical protein